MCRSFSKAKRLFALVGLVGLTVLGTGASHAKADVINLFTTADDFSGWSNPGPAATTSRDPTVDHEFDPINGLGNTTAAGLPGVPGSMLVNFNTGAFDYVYSEDEKLNAPFLTALGSSGFINFDYQVPANQGGTYFGLGLVLNYTGNFGQFFGGTTVNDGDGWFTRSIPYTVNVSRTGTYGYFQLGVGINSNYDHNGPTSFNVDNINIPEPTSLGLLSLGSLLTLRRRRSL